MVVWNGPRGGRITENSFVFKNLSGSPGAYLFAADADGHWELALLESGVLSWRTPPGLVDFCLVGAGKNGSVGGIDQLNYVYSGKGGDSGGVYTQRGIFLRGSCQVTVGATNGAATEITCGTQVYTSNAGSVRTGATGSKIQQGMIGGATYDTEGGKDGVWLYETEEDESIIPALQGHRVAASGGGGHVNSDKYIWSDLKGATNKGGDTDGANGGTRDHHKGYDATGYGNGGGGGYSDGYGKEYKSGGAGSPGIAVFRGHQEVAA